MLLHQPSQVVFYAWIVLFFVLPWIHGLRSGPSACMSGCKGTLRRSQVQIRFQTAEVMGSNPISDTGVDLSLDFTHVKPLSQISEHGLNMPLFASRPRILVLSRWILTFNQNGPSSHHPPSVCMWTVCCVDRWLATFLRWLLPYWFIISQRW